MHIGPLEIEINENIMPEECTNDLPTRINPQKLYISYNQRNKVNKHSEQDSYMNKRV